MHSGCFCYVCFLNVDESEFHVLGTHMLVYARVCVYDCGREVVVVGGKHVG